MVRVRARYKPSLVFRLSLVFSMVKFMFCAIFNFLARKPLHMVNLTSKINFLGQVYLMQWFSDQKNLAFERKSRRESELQHMAVQGAGLL